jgi:hypothetical protein
MNLLQLGEGELDDPGQWLQSSKAAKLKALERNKSESQTAATAEHWNHDSFLIPS